MPGRPWTREEVERLKAMAGSGTRGAVIAKSLNRTLEAVYSRMQVEGIRVKTALALKKARQDAGR
jgi:hypothetical protein